MAQDHLVVPLGVAGTAYEDLEIGVRGGALRTAMISNPRHFNPIMVRDTASGWVPDRMFMGLVELDPLTAEVGPVLAKSWEIREAAPGAEHAWEIIFHLRRGLVWSDGAPFTADDVMFTWVDLWLNPDVDARRAVWELPDGTLPSFERIDDYTVKVKLTTWFRPALLSIGGTYILPRHKLAQFVHKLNPAVDRGAFNAAWGVDVKPEDMAGMGPFVFAEFIPDLMIRMVRNPNFWQFDPAGNRLPYFDEVRVAIVASIDVAVLKFRNGEIDAISPRPEDLPILLPEGPVRGYTVLIGEEPFFGNEFLTFHQDVADANLRRLFRDLRFRRAVAHATDKDTMIETIFMGLAVKSWSPVSIPSPFYAPEMAIHYEYDLEKSAALLDEIGIVDRDGDGIREFEDGTPVSFTILTNAGNTMREQIALIMQDDLTRLGLDVDFTPIPFADLVGKLLGAEGWEAVVIGFTGGIDPHGAGVIWRGTGDLHFWRYSAGGPEGEHPEKFPVADPQEWNARVDELWDLQASALTDAEAYPYFAEFQRLVAENLPLIYTAERKFTLAYYDHLGNAAWSDVIATAVGSRGSIFSFRKGR
jgi:peptide/nickel transport system substrate-binding protein